MITHSITNDSDRLSRISGQTSNNNGKISNSVKIK